MTRFVALVVYGWLYLALYLMPCVFAAAFAERWVPSLLPMFGVLAIGLFLLAGYRSHLAAQAYGARDMGFWNAHFVAGQMLRLHLTFLPLIGHWFRKRD